MHYTYLSAWNSESDGKIKAFKEILKFEDQYLIRFKSDSDPLQINLSSRDSFIFFTDKAAELDFANSPELNQLNNHLMHSRLTNTKLDNDDRIFFLSFEKYNIYNTVEELNLIIELSPRNQNLILTKTKEDKSIILDCLRKISFSDNNTRQILPGLEYQKPDTSYKTEELSFSFPLYIENYKISQNKLSENNPSFFNMNNLFESLYYNAYLSLKKEDFKKQISSSLIQNLKKKQKKLEKLHNDLFTEDDAQIFKKKAELLLASFNNIPTGSDSVTLDDYYLENCPKIKIDLNKALSTKQNIDFYFKKYKKAQSGRIKVQEQIQSCQIEISEIEREIENINQITDLNELKIYKKNELGKTNEDKKTLFRRLKIDDAWEIFIGRSSKENDQLTCKVAQINDYWFHTRIFQGTHVVLRNYKKQVPNDTLLHFCSRLAAYYSKAKTSINVPVDYTQIKYVRKPRGSVAGYVTYTNQKTLFVTPLSIRDAAEILRKGDLK